MSVMVFSGSNDDFSICKATMKRKVSFTKQGPRRGFVGVMVSSSHILINFNILPLVD